MRMLPSYDKQCSERNALSQGGSIIKDPFLFFFLNATQRPFILGKKEHKVIHYFL